MTNITRRQFVLGVPLALPCLRLAEAQSREWTEIPSITALSRADDAQVQLVRDTAQFWNVIFSELGTPFRLGTVAFTAGALPVDQLKDLSDKVLSRTGVPELLASIDQMPGDLIGALSDGNFISFTARWPGSQKALVGIKSAQFYPLTLPNVARNVIAHELGHAIGLGHNSDPTMLMRGRPAPCRPDAFASQTARYFSLTTEEKAMLRTLYPANWQPG